MRAARVGARLFAARNECLEEVEDDCDDKEYARHGVPSETGGVPCLRCHVSTLNIPKTFRNSEKTDLDEIAFFVGGGIETMPRQKITCSGVQEYRVRRFFGRAKTSTMPIPCRIGKANTSVRAEIGGAEHSQYYCSPACGNGIRNRKDIGARPCFSALFARLILTKTYRYGIFSLCGALCAACFRCHLRGEEG